MAAGDLNNGDWFIQNAPAGSVPRTTIGVPTPGTPGYAYTQGPGMGLPSANPNDPSWIPSGPPPGSAPGSTQLAVPGGGIGPTTGAGGQDYAGIIKNLQAQFPATDAGFQQLVQALNQQGIKATI